eukprot:TRINITY_DN7304_c0_g1_i1.p1 TRINITY_DN7304_c0_g1~~TRINITY_DN7304_c0_g1_i1.p1  ORF type:complete len:547 (+),score=177.20 TRINITY_DN7304_c0_g1_i1:44-1642(+)
MKTSLLVGTLLVYALCALAQPTTVRPGSSVFFEDFSSPDWQSTWTISKNPKYTGTWRVEAPAPPVAIEGDKGLVAGDAARHHAIVAPLNAPIDNSKDLVVQYEVKLQKGLDCGGAYVKLLSKKDGKTDYTQFSSDDEYTIMFGPDRCGTESKVHFIIRHRNPLTGAISEHHMMPRPPIKNDKNTHLYTLYIKKDNTYSVEIDRQVAKQGSLFSDFEPSINPPKEIDDPTDSKPSDWVDEARIPDVDATKPDDWDESEPTTIPDASATKPSDWNEDEPEFIPDPENARPEGWDDEEDGEWIPNTVPNPACEEHGCGKWTAPMIKNPKYKGKWVRPLIDNPAYKGEWKARQIPNPDFFEDPHPHAVSPAINAVGIEIWTMTDSIMFDNFLITHDKKAADEFADKTWALKRDVEKPEADTNEEGYLETMARFAEELFNLIQANPVIAIATGLALLVPFMLCFFCTGGDSRPTQQEEDEDIVEEEEEIAEDIEEEQEEEEVKEVKRTSKGKKEKKPEPIEEAPKKGAAKRKPKKAE